MKPATKRLRRLQKRKIEAGREIGTQAVKCVGPIIKYLMRVPVESRKRALAAIRILLED